MALKPQPGHPQRVARAHGNRGKQFDLGLEVLQTERCMAAMPDHGWTLDVIAAVCGVTKERIRQIEHQALRKLRWSLMGNGGPRSFSELVERRLDIRLAEPQEDL